MIFRCFLLTLVLCLTAWGGEPSRVENGMNPTQDLKLLLSENLRVGADTDETNLSFGSDDCVVDVDAKGNILMTLPIDNRIVLLDPEGHFVRDIGKKGQGPGEYLFIQRFQLQEDGTGVAFETLGPTVNLSFYDKDYNFIERKTINTGMTRAVRRGYYSPAGTNLWVESISLQQGSKTMPLSQGFMNPELTEMKIELVNYDRPAMDFQRFNQSAFWVEVLGDEIKPVAKGLFSWVAYDRSGTVYTALGKDYEITRWDRDLNKTLIFGRSYKPIPQPQEEIDAIMSPINDRLQARLPPEMKSLITEKVLQDALVRAEVPPIKPPINGLIAMENGYLAVIHDASLLKNKATLDIFNEKGEYVGRGSLPLRQAMSMVFREGQAYGFDESEDHEGILIRYSYKLAKASDQGG